MLSIEIIETIQNKLGLAIDSDDWKAFGEIGRFLCASPHNMIVSLIGPLGGAGFTVEVQAFKNPESQWVPVASKDAATWDEIPATFAAIAIEATKG